MNLSLKKDDDVIKLMLLSQHLEAEDFATRRCLEDLARDFSISFRFDYVSEDESTAFFKAEIWIAEVRYDGSGREIVSIRYPKKNLEVAVFATFEAHYRQLVDWAERPAYFPAHLRGVFSDVGLLGLTFDSVSGEVGLDWKKLLQGLFREEAYSTSKVMTPLVQQSCHLSRECC